MHKNLKVHSIYEKVINAVSGDNTIVTITNRCEKILPEMLIIETYDKNDFCIGDELKICDDVLNNNRSKLSYKIVKEIDNDELYIDNNLTELTSIISKCDRKSYKRILDNIKEKVIEISDNKNENEGFYLLLTKRDNLYTSYIRKTLNEFITSLNEDINNDIRKVQLLKEKYSRFGEKLIGCGIGLTPSSDDTLTGIMFITFINIIIYCVENKYDVSDTIKKIDIAKKIFGYFISDCKNRTTDVSYNFLKFAASGYFSKDLFVLIKYIFANDEEKYLKEINDIADYGSTSGLDILTGIIIANK